MCRFSKIEKSAKSHHPIVHCTVPVGGGGVKMYQMFEFPTFS